MKSCPARTRVQRLQPTLPREPRARDLALRQAVSGIGPPAIARECTPQGLLRNPVVELRRLIVDGKDVTPALTATRAPRGARLADRYHSYHVPAPAPGEHSVTAWVRAVDAGTESSRTISFTV